MHHEAARLAIPRLEFSTKERRPFAQAREPVAAAVRRAAAAVIADIDVDHPLAVGDDHARVRLTGVLHDVGQRLLDYAVGADVEARRELHRLADHARVDRHARPPHVLGECVEVRETRLWDERRPLIVAT